ncbi:MAG: iron-containing redox enzyme family protein [Hyphomicrobiales bacterium]
MTFFHRLAEETAPERQYLMSTPQIVDGLKGDITLPTYLDYLQEAYHHVKHTVPLMNACRARLSERQKWLVPALDEYIDEETGHELWILEDIGAAGGDAAKAKASTPRFATEVMVSYAYDFINRLNPAGFFGMVFVLEGTSTQIATHGADAIQKSLKLGDECFHYLKSHGSLDIAHMRFFESLMAKVENRDDQDAVLHMARRMFILFSNMFRSIPHKAV